MVAVYFNFLHIEVNNIEVLLRPFECMWSFVSVNHADPGKICYQQQSQEDMTKCVNLKGLGLNLLLIFVSQSIQLFMFNWFIRKPNI